ncbi:MAG TPA: FliH/SctL family protein [Terracidiphilus sp.]|nr:FliH/SctL family protein [Terracidiphilus sp.]
MQAKTANNETMAERIELFEYPHDPHAPPQTGWQGWMEEDENSIAEKMRSTTAALKQEFERRLEEETRRAFDAGREQSRQEERKTQLTALASAREEQKRQMAALAESFALERDRYLQAVEHEVVRLALAVAARILRREAQMDPLLLTGAVRVALGQLSASTEVRLRVPQPDCDLWREAMALLPNLPLRPEVVGEDGLRLGDCLIETKLGTVDLGLRAQLAEIERGFFDRVLRSESVPKNPIQSQGHA